jgi:exonuclease SbcC
MTPLSIEIEGVRSFVTSRTIDFAGLDLFAIVGDTGSGKSSILEAMIYALFNGTSWDGREVKELMSTGATRMKVRFRFSLGERTYTITRSTPNEGAAIHLLECDGLPDERRDSERAVSARLSDLLGVNREQFIKTVILPQGEFAALLTLKPGDRAKLLTDVLGLGIIDDIAANALVVRQRARSRCDELRGRRSSYPDNPADALRNATAVADLRAAEEHAMQIAIDEIHTNMAELGLLGQRAAGRAAVAKSCATIRSEFSALQLLRTIDDVLRQNLERAELEHAESRRYLDEAAEELGRAKADGTDAEAVARVQNALVKLSTQWTELSRERSALESRKAEYVSVDATLAEQKAALDVSRANVQAAAAVASAAKVRAETASSAREMAEKTFAAFSRAKTAVSDATKAQALAATLLAEKTAEFARTSQLDGEADENLTAARARLNDAERENAAAHAAHGLAAGDPCPVCHRALPPKFRPPVAIELDQAKRDVKQAESRRRESSKANTQADAEALFAQKAAKETDQKVRLCRMELDKAAADAKDAGVDVEAKTSEAFLAGVREAASAADAARSAAQEALTAVQGDAARVEIVRDTLAARSLDIKKDIAGHEDRIAARLRDVGFLQQQIPARYFQATAELSEQLLAAAEAQLGIAAETARKVNDSYVAALRAEREAAERLRTLVERQRSEIDQPIAATWSRLLSSRDIASAAGFSMPVEPEVKSKLTLLYALEWGQALLAASASAESALAKQATDDEAAMSLSNTKIAALLQRFEVKSAAELESKRENALRALGAATTERDGLAVAAVEAAKLDTELANVEPAMRALDVLYSFLSGTKFKKFVTDRKQERLLGVATSILRRMTNERYGFGADMRIVDRSASQARSPETLSGGEKFLASLALALALVEIAKRSGRHFGALFLDEGFGSLDPQALDEALSELERQSQSGRMIGVITHIRAVMEYIEDVLRVVRTPNGSEVLRDADDDELEPAESAGIAVAIKHIGSS